MDATEFETAFQKILLLDGSEGPSRNVLEPKFEARERVLKLQSTIAAAPSSDVALGQLSKIHSFLGTNYYECEEDKEAEKAHCIAFAMATTLLTHGTVSQAYELPCTVDAIIKFDPTDGVTRDWAVGLPLLEVLNAVGVFLSSRSVALHTQDALKVLITADAVYLRIKEVAPSTALENAFTNTTFYLAQAHTALGHTAEASRCCHITMARQMRSNLAFSKKEWATNALHLGGFYASEGHFGAALHCLQAARMVMPSEPADEETVGIVAWGFGKFYKGLLKASANRDETVNPAKDNLNRAQWWQDFPVENVSPPTQVALSQTFAEARDVFREAVKELQTAATYYTFDTCCPDHIAIQKDIGECYKWLTEFEPDVERKAAMLERRLDALVRFPDLLSFNAYATLTRQLLFDLGDMSSDLFDLRINQKQQPSSNAGLKPLSDKKLNELRARCAGYFSKFLATFEGTPMDIESRVPVLRAMMRLARLDMKEQCKTAQDEYHAIGRAMKRYDEIASFIETKGLARNPEVETEVRLALEMKTLLPGKQREIARTFQR